MKLDAATISVDHNAYDRCPAPIGVAVCDDAVMAMDVAGRLHDKLLMLERVKIAGGVKTTEALRLVTIQVSEEMASPAPPWRRPGIPGHRAPS